MYFRYEDLVVSDSVICQKSNATSCASYNNNYYFDQSNRIHFPIAILALVRNKDQTAPSLHHLISGER